VLGLQSVQMWKAGLHPFLRSGKIIPALYADPIKESKAKIERSFYKR